MKAARSIITGILAAGLLSSCTVVSCDRVFPKLAWYWSADAKRQRESDAREKRLYQFNRTNDWSQMPR